MEEGAACLTMTFLMWVNLLFPFIVDHGILDVCLSVFSQVWLALLRNRAVDLGDPLAVASCAEDSIARRKATAKLFRGESFGDISDGDEDEEEEDDDDEDVEEYGGGGDESGGGGGGGKESGGDEGGAGAESGERLGAASEGAIEDLMAGLGGFGEIEETRDSVFEQSSNQSAEDALFGMMDKHSSGGKK
jgi:hypothetical protein